jgi:hypothetical protein
MIKIIKEKGLKSSTKVEGILVQVTGGQWYGITRFFPSRNPWFGRAGKSTSTGKIDFGRDQAVFMKWYKSQPDWEELKTILLDVLNNKVEAPQDKMTYL